MEPGGGGGGDGGPGGGGDGGPGGGGEGGPGGGGGGGGLPQERERVVLTVLPPPELTDPLVEEYPVAEAFQLISVFESTPKLAKPEPSVLRLVPLPKS